MWWLREGGGRDDLIGPIYSALYEAAVSEKQIESKGRASKAGHEFEDRVAEALVTFSSVSGVKKRTALAYPTLSGMKHQYDCIFVLDGGTYVVECKKQNQQASKNQIYYFNSTITDHALGMKVDGIQGEIRGIFLSTTDLDEPSAIYAVFSGIRVITPGMPPPEYMAERTDPASDLFRIIKSVISGIPAKNPLFFDKLKRPDRSAPTVYEEYMTALAEWKAGRGQKEGS